MSEAKLFLLVLVAVVFFSLCFILFVRFIRDVVVVESSFSVAFNFNK